MNTVHCCHCLMEKQRSLSYTIVLYHEVKIKDLVLFSNEHAIFVSNFGQYIEIPVKILVLERELGIRF